MSARSARRPLPALIFLLALAILAVVVWIRVSQRDSDARANASPTCAVTTASSALPANAAITVNVLNANGATGLATTTLDAFGALGFTKGTVDNYTGATPVAGVGVIAAGPSGAAAAKLIGYYLPGATLQVDDRADTSVTVTIGPGYTALAGAAAVAADLAKAGLKQSVAPTPTPPPSPAGSAPASGTASGSPSVTSTC